MLAPDQAVLVDLVPGQDKPMKHTSIKLPQRINNAKDFCNHGRELMAAVSDQFAKAMAVCAQAVPDLPQEAVQAWNQRFQRVRITSCSLFSRSFSPKIEPQPPLSRLPLRHRPNRRVLLSSSPLHLAKCSPSRSCNALLQPRDTCALQPLSLWCNALLQPSQLLRSLLFVSFAQIPWFSQGKTALTHPAGNAQCSPLPHQLLRGNQPRAVTPHLRKSRGH